MLTVGSIKNGVLLLGNAPDNFGVGNGVEVKNGDKVMSSFLHVIGFINEYGRLDSAMLGPKGKLKKKITVKDIGSTIGIVYNKSIVGKKGVFLPVKNVWTMDCGYWGLILCRCKSFFGGSDLFFLIDVRYSDKTKDVTGIMEGYMKELGSNCSDGLKSNTFVGVECAVCDEKNGDWVLIFKDRHKDRFKKIR